MFVGHVAVMADVIVVTHNAQPANTRYVQHMTFATIDVLVTYT